LRLPAPGPLALPHPSRRRSPFEAYVSRAVYAPLSELGGAEVDGDQLTFVLHEGVMRHNHRPLEAREVLRSLARLLRTPMAHWLAPVARRGTRLDGEAVDTRTLRLRLAHTDVQIDRWLECEALAPVVAPGVGAGPFRPRLIEGGLRLSQFRAGVRAPYLRRVFFGPARPREDELRALVLGELDGSWAGDSLLGERPTQAMRLRDLNRHSHVLLSASERRRRELGAIEGWLDRERLRRVGLSAERRIGGVGGPAAARLAISGRRTLRLPAGDSFARALGEALVALFDEQGIPLRLLESGSADFALAQSSPALPSSQRAAVADALAQTGERGAAAQVLEALRPRPAEAPRLNALVLGRRALTLHLDADVSGGPNLWDFHLPRRRIEVP
ncbi:MAG: hypothetical protein AAF411_12570, partial [Myxococcota bacterium]